ncbi:PIN domain-containing protein [Roseateles amylovorans]|uniref:PIN domain-containing protein n=1 Tax=Roseateles amylovorans TaxID=2978473 RepID=A0ABY6B6T6_9BURK|nr:PIN domain-containing protein [Roseateles amylovorans]UXH78920.1 PIN domain-containing protein [Roseateles amylovorans]
MHAPQPPQQLVSPVLVLDTQIVMDWVVFGEASLSPLIDDIESGRLRWIATQAMKGELVHVIARGVAASYAPDLQRVNDVFSRHCQFVEAPILGMARPRCSDPDDQKFIDLALAQCALQPTCLISRDRAVLKVARRAAKLGLDILSPGAWLARRSSLD